MLRAKIPSPRLPFHITRGLIGIYETQGGELWLGGTMEDSGFNQELTEVGRNMILSGAAEIFPSIADAEILEHLTGFRPATPDKLPIVGPVTNWRNAYVAGGSGPKGMLLSSGLADVVSSCILGKKTSLNVQQFLPDRFF